MSMKKVLAIGIFDGVHAGHQQIIATAKHIGEVTVITFDPHPTSVIAPERTPTQLISLKDRITLLKKAGATSVEVIKFDKDFSVLTPDQFIENILIGRFAAEHIVVGENFNFGFKAQGTPKYLSEVGPKYGFGVSVVKLQEDKGSTISSSRIRNLIIDGQVEVANELLTRNFYLKGIVVHGEKRGREIGYPTANIGLTNLATIPADGVYAGWLSVGSERWPAAISIGTNPTFPGVRGRQVEAYALDKTDLELYDLEATIEFGFRLRDTLKFDGLEPLLEQMKKDCDQARELTSK
jgi:riboflavin kinase/FMN adenylyltransferase